MCLEAFLRPLYHAGTTTEVEGKGIIKDNVNDTYGQRERDVNDPVVAVCLQRGSIGTLGQRFKPKNDRGQRRRQSPFFENRREATRGLPVQAQYERGNTKDARSSREVEHGSIHRGDGFFDERQDTKWMQQTNSIHPSQTDGSRDSTAVRRQHRRRREKMRHC